MYGRCNAVMTSADDVPVPDQVCLKMNGSVNGKITVKFSHEENHITRYLSIMNCFFQSNKNHSKIRF
jgi:hypothetical protein